MTKRFGKRSKEMGTDVEIVTVDALKQALPIFWLERLHIWDIPADLGPGHLIIFSVARDLGARVTSGSLDLPIVALQTVLAEIQALRPTDAGAIFTRLWWLAEWLDGSAIEPATDLLVASGQTSAAWEATLAAAARVPGKTLEVSPPLARFELALEDAS